MEYRRSFFYVLLQWGVSAIRTIIAVGLFNSIMFPTIFSMALNRLGKFTGQGSGILCMAIVGGAIVPFLQGFLADNIGLQWSFFLPAACYVFILFFGKYKTRQDIYNLLIFGIVSAFVTIPWWGTVESGTRPL